MNIKKTVCGMIKRISKDIYEDFTTMRYFVFGFLYVFVTGYLLLLMDIGKESRHLFWNDKNVSQYTLFILMLAIFTPFTLLWITNKHAIEKQRKKIDSLELQGSEAKDKGCVEEKVNVNENGSKKKNESKKNRVSFLEYFKVQLEIIGERARLLMIKAEGRSGYLNLLGIILTLASIVGPGYMGVMYWQQKTIDGEAVFYLQLLRNIDGDLPAQISLPTSRDWRTLVSGVSFGFLFLGAAGIIFSHYKRQMEIYFRLNKNLQYFERIIAAMNIREKADKELIPYEQEKLVDSIIAELLKPPSEAQDNKQTDEETQNLLKGIIEIVKINTKQ